MITQNFSYKIFYALGVAGLILLGGTDLSVGRMVTLGTLITCMSLNPDTTVSFFGIRLADMYSTLGVAGTAIIALILSILMCTLFSAVAGFFSAKFKIHPFISTLATSLTIWGLCAVGTNTIKTGGISTDGGPVRGGVRLPRVDVATAVRRAADRALSDGRHPLSFPSRPAVRSCAGRVSTCRMPTAVVEVRT